MARYAVDGQDTNTAGTSILNIFSDGNVRPQIYDMMLGSDATPADNAAEYAVQRTTGVGTEGSGVTPTPLDPLTPASATDGAEAHSGEPTYTANLIGLQWGQNQRATYRWVAAPGGELVAIATAANGWGIQTIGIAGSAVNTNCTMHFRE